MGVFSNIFSVKNEYDNNKKRKVIKVLGAKIKLKAGGGSEYKTVHYIIQMLKQYGIKNIVSSAGSQNSMFNLLVQDDKYFNCYSVADERSAGYMAVGIAEETKAPAVIACTGASASRNWLPALTEAFYKNIPIIAIPFYNRAANEFSLSAQYINRQITQTDIKQIQVKLPEISDEIDIQNVLTYLNTALAAAKYNKKPVIIESPSNLFFEKLDDYKKFPENIWHTEVIEDITNEAEEFADKNVAVFIGSHKNFSKEDENAVSEFSKSLNIPVFCDHTSNYHGSNKVLSAQAVLCKAKLPDLLIDIGGITGDYQAKRLFSQCKIWRVSPPLEREFKFRFKYPVDKTFFMPEKIFFQKCRASSKPLTNYYQEVKSKIENIIYPDLPLSNCFIISNLAKYIPEGSILHYGVSNTKRSINYYKFSETIDASCNVGACGIDGAVSTLIGHSFAAPDKNVFGVMGDLTFFYDMNALQNRDIKNNLRILVINNNKGIEFKVSGLFKNNIDETEKLICAGGHHTTAGGWAQSCGFHYMCADNKESFLEQIKNFCIQDFKKPVLFEVFTTDEDEIRAVDLIKGIGN